MADAERAYRLSAEIDEALGKANPENVDLGDMMGMVLNNPGNLLIATGRMADAERAYRRSVGIDEALWEANSENAGFGDGLGGALSNLGTLLRAADRVADARRAYRRSVAIYEALGKANPENVNMKAHCAGSLCGVGRWEDAERLVDEVLSLIPTHPYAGRLKKHIAAARRPRWWRRLFGRT